MSYWRQFDDFDPKEGGVPSHPFGSLQDILNRARFLLRDRTKEEIRAAAELVDGFIDNFFEQEIESFIEYQLENDGWAKGYILEAQASGEYLTSYVKDVLPTLAGPKDYIEYVTDEDISEVDALIECIYRYDIAEEAFKNGKKYECFAVLSLWLVADCARWLKRNEGKDAASAQLHTVDQYAWAGDSALKAMHAVSYAEILHRDEQSKAKIRELQLSLNNQEEIIEEETERRMAHRRSEAARNAAIAKHSQPGGSRDKKKQIRAAWATGKYSSRDQCAEQESAALGMSYASARKALINAPNP